MKPGIKYSATELADVKSLHWLGYSDLEIAEHLDRSARAVQGYRRKLNLPPLPQSCRKRVAKFNEKGLLDREIAQILSKFRPISCVQVSAIRRSLGKKPHKRNTPGSTRTQVHSFEHYRAKQLKSDAEIARLYAGAGYARSCRRTEA